MYKIMALAMTAAMVVPMAAQTTAFAADDKEITYWNIAVESPDKDLSLIHIFTLPTTVSADILDYEGTVNAYKEDNKIPQTFEIDDEMCIRDRG